MVPADMAARIEHAREIARRCHLCERRCGVDRLAGERGYNGLGARSFVFYEGLHFGEEIDLVPSHIIYLTGCNLRCVYCVVGEQILRANVERGVPVDPPALARTVARRRAEGARNVNFCGGEPTVNLVPILETLALCAPDTRVVWNSNFYHTDEVAAVLDGVVDVWLADWKYGNDACARRLSVVPRYGEVLERNVRRALAGGARVIVRYLVLPGHTDCCFEPIARWLGEHAPAAEVSVLDQYTPFFRAAKVRGLERPGSSAEADDVRRRAERHGLRLVA
jgi:putative pyruvate formate lyase activating enzyme